MLSRLSSQLARHREPNEAPNAWERDVRRLPLLGLVPAGEKYLGVLVVGRGRGGGITSMTHKHDTQTEQKACKLTRAFVASNSHNLMLITQLDKTHE